MSDPLMPKGLFYFDSIGEILRRTIFAKEKIIKNRNYNLSNSKKIFVKI